MFQTIQKNFLDNSDKNSSCVTVDDLTSVLVGIASKNNI